MRRVAVLASIALGLALAAPAYAQDRYPSRPIKLLVPFPAGGPVDVMGRLVAQHLSTTLGQQVIIDNRPGAGGIIGTELGARSPKDGYTLIMGSGAPLTINPSVYDKLPYDDKTPSNLSFLPGLARSGLVRHKLTLAHPN